ncbi:MAG: hypothetical protein K0V04_17310 [Deltaproteobacteria bacterium]|nr:hypothetical protein [Deltaproteobacteria bacterium]
MKMNEAAVVPTSILLDSIDRDHATGMCGDVVVQVWAGAVTPAMVEALIASVRACDRSDTDGVAVLLVTQPEAPTRMTRATARTIAAQLDAVSPRVRALAISMSGAGLQRWIRSGLLRSISMSARARSLRTFAALDEAVTWIADDLQCTRTDEQLRRAVAELEQRIERCRQAPPRPANSSTVTLPANTG